METNNLLCSACKQLLPLDEFWKDKLKKTGYSYYCISCYKKFYDQPVTCDCGLIIKHQGNLSRHRKSHKHELFLLRKSVSSQVSL